MSGPQHIAWYKASVRATGSQKLLDLSVRVAPYETSQFERIREMLVNMSRDREQEN